jgi:hypothetical protein
VTRLRHAVPVVIAFALTWWLLVPVSVGFGLRWLFTGYKSAANSVFNPADPSVYMLWLRVGFTAGAAFAIHVAGASGSRPPRSHESRHHVSGSLIVAGIAAAMSAPYVIQHVEAHATRTLSLALFGLCGAASAVVCSVLLKRMREGAADHESTQPL